MSVYQKLEKVSVFLQGKQTFSSDIYTQTTLNDTHLEQHLSRATTNSSLEQKQQHLSRTTTTHL